MARKIASFGFDIYTLLISLKFTIQYHGCNPENLGEYIFSTEINYIKTL